MRFELFETVLVLCLDGLLDLGLLDLDVVLLVLDDLGDLGALVPPVGQLGLVVDALLVGVVHVVALLTQLIDLDFVVHDPLLSLLLDVLDLRLVLGDYLVVVLLVPLLERSDLGLQIDQHLHLVLVLPGQSLDHVVPILLLLLELLVQPVHLVVTNNSHKSISYKRFGGGLLTAS